MIVKKIRGNDSETSIFKVLEIAFDTLSDWLQLFDFDVIKFTNHQKKKEKKKEKKKR